MQTPIILKFHRKNISGQNALFLIGAIVLAIGIPVRGYIDGRFLPSLMVGLTLAGLMYLLYLLAKKTEKDYVDIDDREVAYYMHTAFGKKRLKWSFHPGDYSRIVIKETQIRVSPKTGFTGIVMEMYGDDKTKPARKLEAAVELTAEKKAAIQELMSAKNIMIEIA